MSLNHKIPTLGLFIDISKAFDSMNHSILLDKLYCMGFRGLVHFWLSDYLSSRFQYVEVNGKQSSYRKISCGIPQGSILGPLIFLLRINDLPNFSDKLSCSLFADDNTVTFSDSSLKNYLNATQIELIHVFDWFVANKLMINFNFSKSGCLSFRSVLNLYNKFI